MTPDVWAPLAERVEVVLDDGSRHALRPDAATGWHRGGPQLAHGQRYAFSLDGGEPLPDPRSSWQPDGIHAFSAARDPGRFAWTDDRWHGFHLPGAVLYELHIGTFTTEGTFDAAIDRLDHLVDLGIDAIELLPVAAFAGERGWGYDGVLLYAAHHRYGGPDGLHRLVDACHRRGLGVVLDVVYNHLGPQGNHLPRFGPYFHDAHHTLWGSAINLDGAQADEVRRFIIDNARHWLDDFHFDGLRIDAIHALVDDSAIHLLEQLAGEVSALGAALGRKLWLIAESDRNETRPVLPVEAGGFGLDAVWSDDLHHAIHAALTGETDGYYADFGSLTDVARALEHVFVHGGERSSFRQRVHGRSVGALDRHRFVVCAQNHDQIGNRAIGDRLSHIAGPEGAMAAAAIVLCSPFVPLLFQGEEWASSSPFPYFADVDDPELAAAIRGGRHEEFAAFGWDPDDVPDPLSEATARSATLAWEELAKEPHATVLAFVRSLLRLRRARPDLTDGRPHTVAATADDDERWLVLRRPRTAAVLNRAAAVRSLGPHALGGEPSEVLAASHPGVSLGSGATVELPPFATAVVAVS